MERWDIVVRFLNGPLSLQGDMVLRGPVVRIGANPGPSGLKLDGYRALDDRQAVITAYDGGTVAIAPVGTNQVRMAPHENVDWNDIQPIRGPVFLSPGCAIHLGPPGRGATATFIECQRLGEWEQRAILSDSSQVEPEDSQTSEVRQLDPGKRFPWWVVPGFLAILMLFVGGLGILVFVGTLIAVDPLGPVDEGEETYAYEAIYKETEVNTELYKGVEQAFHEFVMKPNIEASGWAELEKPEKWDRTLMQYITRAEMIHGKGWTFWTQLDNVREEYAAVLEALKKAGLPAVFAGIPFQESRYKGTALDTMLCARGYWQFQPEVAKRSGVEVRDCKFRGSDVLWSPIRLAPPRGVLKNAEYVDNGQCRITGCAIDERSDLRKSTLGAVKLLGEAFNDEELRFSGAVTQITIASHNAGYNNAPYQDNQVNVYNMLPAYRQYRKRVNVDRAPDFIGQNLTCKGNAKSFLDRCEGSLGSVTQVYVPYVIAQHMLAVCYYGTNYADEFPAFAEFRNYVRGTGYCTDIDVPTKEEIQKRAGKVKK